MPSIFFNNHPYQFTRKELPMLISSKEREGASYFTIQLTIDLINQAEKIIFFSAYAKAKEDIITHISHSEKNIILIEDLKQINTNTKPVILVKNNSVQLLKQIIEKTKYENRIIIIKNIETFDRNILKIIQDNKDIIVSGDINKYSSKDQLNSIPFITQIFFSQQESTSLPILKQYQGYLKQKNREGFIEVK